jgi:hypothetical protein
VRDGCHHLAGQPMREEMPALGRRAARPSVDWRSKHVCGEHAVFGVLDALDREAAAVDHGLEQPSERGVLVADVLLHVGPAPLALAALPVGRAPGLEASGRLVGAEVVDHVDEPQHAARPQNRSQAGQRERLPEIGEVV